MRLSLGFRLLCISIPLVGVTISLPAAADHQTPAVPTINWAPCGDDFPGIECGKVRVPLDYDHPAGDKITLALARVPASDQANKIGSLFLNPGGPGGSGVELVLFGFGGFLDSALQGRFDIVGFDPRGVGASTPIRCFATNESLDAFFADTPLFPYQRRQERPFFETYARYQDKCFERSRRIAEHMSTADVARDLDLLRRSVGDRALSYLGFSYGSYIGNTYANLFPNKIRALVIDGVLDPFLWSSGLQILSDRVATQEEFEEFLRLCDEAGPENCGLAGSGGASARYAALLASIRGNPVVFPDGFVYTYDFFVADTTGAMYAPESWGGPDGFASFLGFLIDFTQGDASAAARARAARDAFRAMLYPERDHTEYNNGLDSYYGNHCADAEYPRRLESFSAFGEFAERGSFFGPYWWWFNAGCASWPTAEDRYAGPWTTRTSAPVLVVGNYFDGVTDYRGAVVTARRLRNSRLLSYAGWGHTAFGRSDCVTDHVVQYLLDATLPAEGTVCAANANPFLPVAAARARSAAPSAPLIGLPPQRPQAR